MHWYWRLYSQCLIKAILEIVEVVNALKVNLLHKILVALTEALEVVLELSKDIVKDLLIYSHVKQKI